MKIERLLPGHAADYRRLMLEAYARHPRAFTSSVAERAALPLTWWAARLEAGPQAKTRVLGCWQAGALAAVVGLTFAQQEKVRHKAKLFGLYLAPALRGLGLGLALVQTALAEARGRDGVRLVQLSLTEGNQAALALYQRCGFVTFGREPQALAVDGEYLAKLLMSCEVAGP
ncbi:MAG: GNAT family protein [Pseudomonas sp.]|uniref:GNAT family N-acetyltransferase n=1 Tax=Pseudomonas sp. TaxID=306 RepID=UPI00339AA821